MKILLDARLYGLENAGLGRYVINLVQELTKLDRKNSYLILLRKKYFNSLELPSNWQKILVDYRHYSFREQIELPWTIYKLKPDVVHFPHFNVPILYRGKFVVTIHDILMHKQTGFEATTLNPLVYLVKRMGYRFVFKNAVMAAKKIIAPSEAVKNEIIKEYQTPGDKIVVTYEGVDGNLISVTKSKYNGNYFVYTGNAYPHKNLGRLIESVILLNKVFNKESKLYIASARNIFTKRLENTIRKLKAEKFVELLGFVEDREIVSLYKASKAFVFPSLSEGFGLPGLEAMQSGTVVAASDIPVFREIYKDSAIFFDPLNINSIAKTLSEILAMKKDHRKKLITKSQILVRKYSWVSMAEKTLEVYLSGVQ